jgi:hypothetical protein
MKALIKVTKKLNKQAFALLIGAFCAQVMGGGV